MPPGESRITWYRLDSSTGWSRLAHLLLLFAFAGLMFGKNLTDADLWGHIRYGEDVLQSGSIPTYDRYSYTAGDHIWYNHETAAEISLALLYRLGPSAIILAKILVGWFTLAILLVVSGNRPIALLPGSIIAILAISAMALGWAARPQLATYLCFALLLWILDAGARNPIRLWFAPLLLAIWNNFHGGFLFGLGVTGIFLAGLMLQEVWTARFTRPSRLLHWAAVGIVSLLATLIHPNGIGSYLGLIRELGIERLQVAEWKPVEWSLIQLVTLDLEVTHLLLILTVGVLLTSRRPKPLPYLIVIAITALETQWHQRHVVFLAQIWLAWLPDHLQDCIDQFWNSVSQRTADPAPAAESAAHAPPDIPAPGEPIPWSIYWGTFFLGLGIALFGIHHLTRNIWVDRDYYPVDAVAYLQRENIAGRMVIPMNWGQYALFALHDQGILISYDGRYGTVYPADIIDINFDFIYPDDPTVRSRSPSSPPYQANRILETGDPELVLLERGPSPDRLSPAEKVMADETGWTLLYRDGLAALYGRADLFDDPASPHYIPPERRHDRQERPTGFVPFPACRP